MVSQRLAVVFVHGFLSSSGVWDGFASLLRSDDQVGDIDVRAFEYATPRLSFHLLRRIPDLDDIADSLRTYLRNDLPADERVVLVTHSMGGLVAQRFLARTLRDGRGPELARIRQVVMFACPNLGSEILLVLRRLAWFWRHPQERQLRPLTAAVVADQRDIINRVVHAKTLSADKCPIPMVAYAGEQDGVVLPSSARNVFPESGVVPGDHTTIIQPDSHTHRSYTALRRALLAARTAELPAPQRPAQSPPAPRSPAEGRGEQERASVPDQRHSTRRGREPADPVAYRAELLRQLLAVPGMPEPDFRQQVYNGLPDQVAHQLARSSNPRLELVGLLQTFNDYRHLAPWDALLASLELLRPGHPAVRELRATLIDLELAAPPRPEPAA